MGRLYPRSRGGGKNLAGARGHIPAAGEGQNPGREEGLAEQRGVGGWAPLPQIQRWWKQGADDDRGGFL